MRDRGTRRALRRRSVAKARHIVVDIWRDYGFRQKALAENLDLSPSEEWREKALLIMATRMKFFPSEWLHAKRDAHFIPKWADNLKMCSCDMCGNPRRTMGHKTRQEKMAALNEKEQRIESLS